MRKQLLLNVALSAGYILQISDTHISTVDDVSEINLTTFCQSETGLKKFLANSPAPRGENDLELIVITGDMVDGTPSLLSIAERGQIPGEYEKLKTAFKGCVDQARSANVPIMALRGNHDCFGTKRYDLDGYYQHFRGFQENLDETLVSAHWKRDSTDGLVDEETAEQDYQATGTQTIRIRDTAVVLLDNCYLEGTSRHFYGVVHPGTYQAIRRQIDQLRTTAADTISKVVMFSHYPLGSFQSEERTAMLEMMKSLKSQARVEVTGFHAGHLHTQLLYPLQYKHDGVQEWEIPDFKTKSIVRVIAGEHWDLVADFRPKSEDDKNLAWKSMAFSQLPQKKLFAIVLNPKDTELTLTHHRKRHSLDDYNIAKLNPGNSHSMFYVSKTLDSGKKNPNPTTYLKLVRQSGKHGTTAQSVSEEVEIIDFIRDDLVGKLGRFAFIRMPEVMFAMAIIIQLLCIIVGFYYYASIHAHLSGESKNWWEAILWAAKRQIIPNTKAEAETDVEAMTEDEAVSMSPVASSPRRRQSSLKSNASVEQPAKHPKAHYHKLMTFASFGFYTALLVPVIPLLMMQIEPGRYGFVFWWGGILFSDPFRGIIPNDTSNLLIIMNQTKALVIMGGLLIAKKWRNVGTRVSLIIVAIFLQFQIMKQFLIRGGPPGLVGFPCLWDIMFWTTSSIVGWNTIVKKISAKGNQV